MSLTDSKVQFRPKLILGLFIALWIVIGIGDWFMRFHWFRWQDSLFIKPSALQTAPYRPLLTTTNEAAPGGDLSRLIGIRDAEARFAEGKPSSVFMTDEYGFANPPPTEGRAYSIVVAGDSYMLAGPGMSNTFPQRLEKISGRGVYNYSYEGRGSFWGLLRFLLADRFKGHEPDILVWGLIEREIAGSYFSGIGAQLSHFEKLPKSGPRRVVFMKRALSPKALRSSLPNTSAYAQLSARLWNHLRYRLFRRLTPFVVEATQEVGGQPMLLYYPAIDAMRWDAKARNLKQVVDFTKRLHQMAAERGMKLVIVLIPDKERIYQSLIPSYYATPGKPLLPSVLPDLEELYSQEGITAVNLLPVFEDARDNGRLLYWRDDTHWNPDGIRLAAETTWKRIAPLVENK